MNCRPLNPRFLCPWLAMAFMPLLGPSAHADKTVPGSDAAKKVTYEDDVKPILRQHCLSCHHQGERKGGVALDTYQALLEGGGSGEIVYDDGDADSSRLWQLVSHEDTPIMPPNQDRIPDAQLTVLRSWIEGGILENSGSKAKKKKKNALEFVAASRGKPDGPAAMPTTMPLDVHVVTERPAAITAIACSPWAPLIAIAGQQQILFYQSETGDLLGIAAFPEGIAESLRFSRDGAYLIAGGGEHSVRGLVAIYDVKTGDRVTQVGDELDIVLDADANSTLNRVVLGGPTKMLRIYDAADDKLLFDLKKHTDWILSVAYSPDDVLIASSDRSAGLVVWEAATGREYLNLTGHKGSVNAVAWRDDSNVLVSGSDDGTVRLWDMVSGKQVKSINVGSPVLDVAMDHSARLVTASRNGKVTVWKADGGKLSEFSQSSEPALQSALSHDGSRVVFGDWSGQVTNLPLDQPDQTKTLVSNPPTEQVLADELAKRIEVKQADVAASREKWNKLQAAAQTTNAPWKAMVSEIESTSKSAADQSANAKRHREASQAYQAAIASLSSESRDLQDELVATRVGLRKQSAQPADLAAIEQRLGKLLLNLATQRTSELEEQALADQANRQAKENQSLVAKLSAQLPELEQAAKSSQSAADSAKSELETHESELRQLKERLERLRSAIAENA